MKSIYFISFSLILEKVNGLNNRQENRRKVPGITHLIAVASNKGGVGKSTISTNLAVALHLLDNKVGILDADITGPNIPRMLGISSGSLAGEGEGMRPVEAHGIKAVSLGLVLPPDTPVVWRGPMIASSLKQMIFDVSWQELDYMIIDLPPGTSDVSMTLAQDVLLSGVVIATTPQEVSLEDARKAVAMFDKLGVSIFGVIENMTSDIFGKGGGKDAADELGLDFLGSIPLSKELRISSDEGTPLVLSEPEHQASKEILEIARAIDERCSTMQTEISSIIKRELT
jgi:ATP-binding protein involved in chromosome partitioning